MKGLSSWIISFFRLRNLYFFISLYLSILAVWVFLFHRDLSLKDFSQIVPGIATFNDLSISRRVNSLYISVAIFASCLMLCVLLSYQIEKRYGKIRTVLIPWKNLSIIGLIALWFEAIHSIQYNLQVFIFTVAFSLLIYQLIKQYFWIPAPVHTFFIWLSGLSFSGAFLIRDFLDAFFNLDKYPFSYYYIIAFTIILINSIFILTFFRVKFTHLFKLSLPFFCIPLITVFSREMYLILNQRNIHFLSPSCLYVLLIIIPLSIYILILRKNLWVLKSSTKKVFHIYIFPVILAGTSLLAFYQPLIQQPLEMFELANPANSIMRIWKFHEIPILEFLNSHLLSEIFPGLIYTLLNGYSETVDFLIYDFILKIAYIIIIYFFLAKIFNDSTFAFLICFFLPFLFIAFPGNHNFSIITIFIAYRLFKRYSFSKLALLAGWNLFLIFWRIEIGISSIAASIFLWLIFFLVTNRKKYITDIIKVFTIILVSVLFFASLIIFIGKIDLIENIRQAFNYFGGSQAHGGLSLALSKDRYYEYQYFIFPFIIILITLYLVFLYVKKGVKRSPFILYALIFLSVYYLIQAQRGLVRHTLAEGTDTYLSSFFYLIIPLFIFYRFENHKYSKYLFLISMVLIISNFKYPYPKDITGNFETMTRNFERPFATGIFKIKMKRVMGINEFADKEYSAFKLFMDKNFNDDATFIDFSNSPMLYFYTQRQVPSYFNQYLQNTVSAYLQKKNMEYISRMQIPVVVFSHLPERWFDYSDNVPNKIRYYPITNYIYQNYQPYSILNNLYIWVNNKDFEFLKPFGQIDSLTEFSFKSFNLLKYPYVLAKSRKTFIDTITLYVSKSINSGFLIKPGNPESRIFNYLSLGIENQTGMETTGILRYYHNEKKIGEFEFTLIAEKREQEYVIPVSSQYNWVSCKADSIHVSFSTPGVIRISELRIFSRQLLN